MLHNHFKNDFKNKRKHRSHTRPVMIRTLGSSLQVRTEQKATQVLGLVFFLFIICWAPFFTRNLIETIFSDLQMPDCLLTIFQQLGFFSSTINPVIYTIFNRNFRRAFRRILLCKTSKYNLRRRNQQAVACGQSRENIEKEIRSHSSNCNDKLIRMDSRCREGSSKKCAPRETDLSLDQGPYTNEYSGQNVAYYWKFKNTDDFHGKILCGKSSQV